ncbi:MAG: DUF2628 domain-containing protein, partial [Synergistaceae bacterium]|nr:DUF2628 domain-containing protein [Synergistaceae bacterium]
KCVINGQMVFCGTWSWWAFFGGPFYFFYRKMYIPGLIIAASMLLLVVARVPFAVSLPAIASAITAKYLYCRKFVSDLGVAGYPDEPRGDVTHYLTRLGGSNTWAVVLGALLYAFAAAAVIYIILAVILVTAFANMS